MNTSSEQEQNPSTLPQEQAGSGNNPKEFELIAKTFMGLEPVLAKELTQLGANNVQIGRRMVSFTGDKEMMYRANFCLHTAIRILKPILHFKARSADEVYDAVQKVDWSRIIEPGKTFSVDSVVYSEEFRNSRFVTYKVKDAIVDQFRESTGDRPNISVSNPDIRLNIHIAEYDATLSLDSSGESLHRRGYRQESVEAPLNEVLAAGMILMTGWKGDCDFIDPMCGSGTLPIEAALIARNINPGLFRKEFAFERWSDYDKDLFDRIYNDDSQEREFPHHIYGYDIDMKAVNTARMNVRATGLSSLITIAEADFADFKKPSERSLMVMNPPYGERISTPNLLATYKMIGERLKHEFAGNEAWVLSYREECFDQIGLKASIKIPVYNGSLECEFRKYAIFDGKMKEFRSEGGIVKTEEEKRQMAEKHRFKKNREFKKRLDEEEENEAGDIRSFKFYSMEHHLPDRYAERPARERWHDHDDEQEDYRHADRFDRQRRDRDRSDYAPAGKRYDRGGRRFDNNDRRSGNYGGRDERRDGRRFDRNDRRNDNHARWNERRDSRRFDRGGDRKYDKKR